MISYLIHAALLPLSGTLTALMLLSPTRTFAAECRKMESVQASGHPDQNTQYGGHLTQHIYGATPPQGLAQKDKTLFTSKEEYIGAWRNYLSKPSIPVVNCAGDHVLQVVKVSALFGTGKEKIGAFSCKASANDGTCTEMTRTQFNGIAFGFKLNGSTWILNTSYPTQFQN